MKNDLITGVTGQDGAYLTKFLLNKGYNVFGGIRKDSKNGLYRLQNLGVDEKVNLIDLDLTNKSQVFEVIKNHKFNEVYNLGAQSSVGSSWDLSIPTLNVNSAGALYLLEAIKRFSGHTKFYQASTSEMFGKVIEPIQTETTPFYPRSPYAISKLYSHWMTINYRESFGLSACCGILFNHESPLRGAEYITKKITSQLCEIQSGTREKLIWETLMQKEIGGMPRICRSNVVNAATRTIRGICDCNGKTSSVRDFVNFCCGHLGMI